MRFLFLLLTLLVPTSAIGELSIVPASPIAIVGDVIDFTIEADASALVQYTLTLGNETLAESQPCPYNYVSYVPRLPGDYTLTVSQGGAETLQHAQCQFTVIDSLRCNLASSIAAVQAGEPVFFTLEHTGNDECLFTYDVILNNQRIYQAQTSDPVFSYTPLQAGVLTVHVTVADPYGHTCEDTAQITVGDGAPIRLTGASTVFYNQGGICQYTVDAPDVWYAQSDSDFITLSPSCGLPGDPLIVCVAGGVSISREGTIEFASGGYTAEVTIRQIPEIGLEEESYFSVITDTITVNGSDQITWMNAQGLRTLQVDASDQWTAACEAEFVSLACSDQAVHITAKPNTTDAIRSSLITLQCGEATAYVHLFQPPACNGSRVYSIELETAGGIAHHDSVSAHVLASPDTQMLTLYTTGLEPALTFAADIAKRTPQGLLFSFNIPLLRSGTHPFCIVAEGELGVGLPCGGLLTAEAEPPAIVSQTASMTVSDTQALLAFTTTASVEILELLDENNNVQETLLAHAAQIDRYNNNDPSGRYMNWTVALPPDTKAAYLSLDETLCPIDVTYAAPEPAVIYSQFDGRWKEAPYRKSTLEQSGCAIFALSHALDRLGFEDDAILPQALADRYYFALLEGGTMNSTLVGHAGDDLGFKTRYDLYTRLSTIRDKMAQGALFSFSVANGHIAMVADISADGEKFLIVDSAPSATFERIKNTSLYIRDEEGRFSAITDLSQIPGIRYYFENNAFGGAEYWLDVSYVAKRGVRLIQLE